ncbi:hypothetical protein RJ639_040882 [Escallonia herrerae]|uniref:Hydroxyphenylpyruvate reductase n=1 Tax=Escallonia herrerae TaxID=1293975 RepID=A0AA88WT29_9ASTE|nr:hypothetical protein RJ639_040882 [Escallonia herrerae]
MLVGGSVFRLPPAVRESEEKMEKIGVWMTCPMSTYLQQELAKRFQVFKSWEIPSVAEFLHQHSLSIRAVVGNGAYGVDSELIESLPSLEIVASHSAGLDQIDLVKCKDKGIKVTYTPDALTEEVADWAILLILATLRRICVCDRFVRSGLWKNGDFSLTTKFSGKSVGIIGLGRIGLAIAKRAEAFGCPISYSSRSQKPDLRYKYYPRVVDLAANCQILVVACALTNQTHHIINREIIDALGPKGFLINIGRGPHVDEPELASALAEGRLGGAGLDVFEHEPEVPKQFLGLNNVVLSPHVATGSVETRKTMADLVIGNLEAHFQVRFSSVDFNKSLVKELTKYRVHKISLQKSRRIRMEDVSVLMTCPMSSYLEEHLDKRFNLFRFWTIPSKNQFLRENSNHIRAVVVNTTFGADSELVESLPKLEIVASYSVGLDKIDLAKCNERGIRVTNTPDVLTDDVADVAIGLILATSRKICSCDGFVRSGSWRNGDFELTTKFSGKSVGIVGLGRIGSAIARRAEAFGCPISYYSRSKKPNTDYKYYSNIVELAINCQILIVACTLTDETRHIVNREVIDALGPKGILINIGRGQHIDEPELVSALLEGRLGGAGLDVFENEPDAPKQLFGLQNVVLMPHVGSDTLETTKAMADLVIANLEAHFMKKELLTPVV